jgi:hypothetical protein
MRSLPSAAAAMRAATAAWQAGPYGTRSSDLLARQRCGSRCAAGRLRSAGRPGPHQRWPDGHHPRWARRGQRAEDTGRFGLRGLGARAAGTARTGSMGAGGVRSRPAGCLQRRDRYRHHTDARRGTACGTTWPRSPVRSAGSAAATTTPPMPPRAGRTCRISCGPRSAGRTCWPAGQHQTAGLVRPDVLAASSDRRSLTTGSGRTPDLVADPGVLPVRRRSRPGTRRCAVS